MYRANAIVSSWRGLIGWRQDYDVNGEQLESDLIASESGFYYQDEHPMLTLQNIESIMPDYSLVNYPDYSNAVNYLAGNIVKSGGINYEAIIDNINFPVTDNEKWRVFKPVNSFLRQKTEAAILDTVIAFLEKKELNKTAKTILENKSLFDGVGNKKDTVINQDRRAGFEILQTRSKGVTSRLDRIGIQQTVAGNVTVQLHHSSQETALESLILVYTKANSLQWFDLNWSLVHVSDDVDSGGAYYITYKQSEIPGNAIQKQRRWDEPCAGCDQVSEARTWKAISPFVEFHPFTVPEIAGEGLWDIDDNRYSYDNNYGINFQISIFCDYTDFLTEQRDLFKSALRKQLAINLLREMAYNPNSRINQDESTVTKTQLLYEIDGDTRGRNTGINKRYNDSLEAIMLNTMGLNRLCLPCKGSGIKYRGI